MPYKITFKLGVFFFQRKFQIFNSNLRSPPPELMGQYMYGQSNYFGTPYTNTYDHTASGGATATGTTNLLGSFGRLGHSSPPRRRYSIGGLPSASMTDYLNLMQNASESAHLSNLINETSKSITRSSQILGAGAGTGVGTGGGGLIGDRGGISSYPALNICGADTLQSDNIFNLPITNFSSHPNIYSQPNYNNTSSAFYDTTNYLSHQKPFSNYFYSRPHTATYPNTSAYLNPLQSTTNQLPYQSILSQSRHNLLIPSHHTSNPALSSSNWIPSSHNKLASDIYHHNNQNNHYHHHNLHNHPFSSGYSNQHFDHHYYQVPKLDLDYSKQAENKRQVSFKFDVDTLSIDS